MSRDSRRTRKLSAIMFTDMVGYSSLSQKNEALALDLLDEQRSILRPLFPKHGGREIETVGDAFFVEFGSALEAVRCAVQIQKTLFERNSAVDGEKLIRLRVGIHLGDVVHRGKKVHGDGVNIAARIEPLSDPGGICISEDVARQVQNKTDITVQKLGRPDLKNISLPVDIYRVVLPWEVKRTNFKGRMLFALKRKRTRIAVAAALGLVVVILFYSLLPRGVDGRRSIAVMPFMNLSGEKEDEYFSQGITEDVITRLSTVGTLRVVSRTSVMRYQNTTKSVKEIGDELDVATVLEGSVRRSGNKVRIVAQLIDAETDEHLWQNTYDQEYSQIFAIQSDVAEKIARALAIRMTPTEAQRLDRRQTQNPEAYDLYLKGRYHWNKRLPDHLNKSISFFEQAASKDPHFAAAHAGISDAYIILGDFNMIPPDVAYPRAKKAAMDALAIDEQLADAHTSLAYAVMHYDWDWETAGEEFRKAIALDSNYAQARSWYALYLAVLGRSDEALQESRKAQNLEPFSAVIRTDVGLVLFALRKYDLVIEQATKALELDPTFFAAYMLRGAAYERKGIHREAIVRFSEMSSVSRGHPITVAAMAHAYATARDSENVEIMLEVLHEKAREQYVSPYWMAVIYAGLGKNDLALNWLESAYKVHDGLMIFVNVDPRFDSLRNEQRFQSLMKRMRFGAIT